MMNKEKALNTLSDALGALFEFFGEDMGTSKQKEFEAMEQFIYKNLSDGEGVDDTVPMTLEEHIQSVFDKYTDWDGNLVPSVLDTSLDEALEKVFMAHSDECKHFSIAMETTFENPSYITGYISFCWIDDYGNLNHETAQWEVL